MSKKKKKKIVEAPVWQPSEEFVQWFDEFDMDQFLHDNFEDMVDCAVKKIETYLTTEPVKVIVGYNYNAYFRNQKNITESLTAESYRQFVKYCTEESYVDLVDDLLKPILVDCGDFLDDFVIEYIVPKNETLQQWWDNDEMDAIVDAIVDSMIAYELSDSLTKIFTIDHITELLKQNPRYSDVFGEIEEEERRKRELQDNILDRIPDNYIDLFPIVRQMQRHFVLHIGPTNSGKSHDAVDALMKAPDGIYLSPLRLLAFEQYQKLNNCGIPCSMITGEEQKIIEGACHQSSTVEMLDISKHYSVAVIDEAQMLGDENRGSFWTSAILGVCADTVHVCSSPEAKDMIIRLIESCGDTVEVHEHSRLAALEQVEKPIKFPEDVVPGDTVIVFSRKMAHVVAAELNERDLQCSVVYGALPYDVRNEEVRRFNSGETDVVVATDAIGMGLNLDIRRVVFLELTKFDGKERRKLYPEEIAQIAGRAGRYGKYDVGYYGYSDASFPSRPSSLLPSSSLQTASIAFPERLIHLDAKLSDIYRQWQNIKAAPGFLIRPVKREIELAEWLEKRTDDKELIYKLVTIPFSEQSDYLLSLWKRLSILVIGKEDLNIHSYISTFSLSSKNMETLEKIYANLDLLYNFASKWGRKEEVEEVMEAKDQVSNSIMQLLKKQAWKKKHCSRCGKKLPWNFQYSMCEECYSRMRRKRSNYYDDYYDDYDLDELVWKI